MEYNVFQLSYRKDIWRLSNHPKFPRLEVIKKGSLTEPFVYRLGCPLYLNKVEGEGTYLVNQAFLSTPENGHFFFNPGGQLIDKFYTSEGLFWVIPKSDWDEAWSLESLSDTMKAYIRNGVRLNELRDPDFYGDHVDIAWKRNVPGIPYEITGTFWRVLR